MKKLHVKIIPLLLAAITVIYAAGCSAHDKSVSEQSKGGLSSSSSDAGAIFEGAEYDYNSGATEEFYKQISDSAARADDTRKIIKTVSLDLETRDFDKAIKDLEITAVSSGGYVELSNVSGRSYNDYGDIMRSASYTLRIPAVSLDDYVNKLSKDFNVLNRQENSTDITDTYFDSKSRLDSLLTQEERLLAMLEGANELEYMLKLEDKLSEVRYKIESLNSTLQRFDKSVSMATIHVYLREVVEYQKIIEPPKTFGERIYNSFTESWSDFRDGLQDFTVDLVYALPTLLLLAAIISIVTALIVRKVKRSKKRKAEASFAQSNNEK